MLEPLTFYRYNILKSRVRLIKACGIDQFLFAEGDAIIDGKRSSAF